MPARATGAQGRDAQNIKLAATSYRIRSASARSMAHQAAAQIQRVRDWADNLCYDAEVEGRYSKTRTLTALEGGSVTRKVMRKR